MKGGGAPPPGAGPPARAGWGAGGGGGPPPPGRAGGGGGRWGEEGVAFGGRNPERPQVLRGAAPSPVPAAPQTGQGEPSGEPPAAVPGLCSVRPGIAGERDGIPGDLSRIGLTEPQPHQ